MLFDAFNAECRITVKSNDLLKKIARKIQKQALYENDKFIQSLKFSNNWICSFKKDYDL